MKKVLLIVETNFIKNIVLKQDLNCAYLTDLAGQRKLDLAIPEYSLLESSSTTRIKLDKWNRNLINMINQLNEIARSRPFESLCLDIKNRIRELGENLKYLNQEMDTIINEFTSNCIIAPYTIDIWFKAHKRSIAKKPPYKDSDRSIYESILSYVADNKNSYNILIFYTSDKKDFDHQEIMDELTNMDVEIYFNSGEVVRRVHELI
ncbi:MAG: PIN domain-containing protein [Methanosarcinales archaeon]